MDDAMWSVWMMPCGQSYKLRLSKRN